MSRSATEKMTTIPRVPESMKTDAGVKPAFIPRLVGMGLYHHFHPELYRMEGVKLAAAKSGLQRFNIPDFHSFLRQLRPLLPRIRACYDGATAAADLGSPELECAIAVDGLFLLSFLCDELPIRVLESAGTNRFSFHDSRKKLTLARKLSLVLRDFVGLLRAPAGDDHQPRPANFLQLDLLSTVLHDAVLLENQVPISILAEAVAPFHPDVRQLVADHLHSLCTFLSPVQLAPISTPPLPAAHLLAHLYRRITAGNYDGGGSLGIDHEQDSVHNLSIAVPVEDGHVGSGRKIVRNFCVLGVRKVTGVLLAAGRGSSFGLLDYFIPGTPSHKSRSNPTAAQLHGIGLSFKPKTVGGGDKPTVEFNEEAQTITVPAFLWHPYTNVVTKNLLAYEAAAAAVITPADNKHRPTLLAQYIHFLHTVARSPRDVDLLIETGVVGLTVVGDDPSPPAGKSVTSGQLGDLMRFFWTSSSPTGGNKTVVGGGDAGTAYGAVKRYYNSRPRVVWRGRFVTVAYLFALVVLYSAELFLLLAAVVVVICGLLKSFTGCTVGGEGSCTANVAAGLMSVVVDGKSIGFHLDA